MNTAPRGPSVRTPVVFKLILSLLAMGLLMQLRSLLVVLNGQSEINADAVVLSSKSMVEPRISTSDASPPKPVRQDPTPKAKGGMVLKVASYNIWNHMFSWPVRQQHIVSLLANELPDIIVLQEVREYSSSTSWSAAPTFDASSFSTWLRQKCSMPLHPSASHSYLFGLMDHSSASALRTDIHINQAMDIQQALPAQYQHLYFGSLEPMRALPATLAMVSGVSSREGLAILSRHPLQDAQMVSLQAETRSGQADAVRRAAAFVRVSVNGILWNVFDVHFSYVREQQCVNVFMLGLAIFTSTRPDVK